MSKTKRRYYNMRNVNPGLMGIEVVPMNATRVLMGNSPLVDFKGRYKKSVKLTAPQLRERILEMYDKGQDTKLTPYLYDANRRGMELPTRVSSQYNPVNEDYLKDLSDISGSTSNKYVGTIMASSAAGTGVAALDYLQDIMSRKSPAHAEGFKTIEDGARSAVGKFSKNKAGRMATDAFTKSTYELLGGKSPKRTSLMNSVIGAAGSAPVAAFATIPLLSPSVTRKLKGEKKGSKRYKTFDWIERHPEATVGAAFAPMAGSALYGSYKDIASVLAKNKGSALKDMVKPLGGSLARSGIALGKVGLGAVAPTAYIAMRKHMQKTKDQEKQLQKEKLRKPIEGIEA